MVSKIAGWAEKAGKKITGGTAIGKNYDTLILDLSYQDNAIYIDIEDGTITIYDEVVNNFNSFKNAIEKHKMAKGGYMAKGGKTQDSFNWSKMNFNERLTLARESGLDNPSKVAITEIGLLKPNEIYAMKNSIRLRNEVNGGYMAKGGKVEDELYVYEYQKGQWTVKDKKNPRAYYTLGSKRENAENVRQAMIDKPSLLKYYRSNEYAQGGVTEKEVVESNAEMVLSKIKEVHHHADELGDIVSKKSDIEAWVVAKIERASTDLSDITHYLDGQHEKMSMGGSINNYVHKMDKK
jgi:hypothetical protein